jgi:light-regulated signal transduction histidine kinase (bacteriophytochrome)
MNSNINTKQIALLCDLDGIILKVLKNELIADQLQGKAFKDIFNGESAKEALIFIKKINKEYVAFNWELNMIISGKIKLLHFNGGIFDNHILIMGTNFFDELMYYYEEMTRITNNQVTHIRKLNKDMLEASSNLKERSKDLEKTLEDLNHSNEQLQSFAYITSHDLQEPLRTIASYAQLIERRYKGKLDSDADDFIEFMVNGAYRMKEMIQGLLEYSRVETKEHEFKEFEAESALKYALNKLGSAISEVNAEITYDELPVIFADESQIIRVFQNLIGNALKFRREEVKPKIHISSMKKDNEYLFSVSDNGIGLDEQYSDQIFEVFKRLHAMDDYPGAGIGLSIVKRIIEGHNGIIWVKSELNKGSAFYFNIPHE